MSTSSLRPQLDRCKQRLKLEGAPSRLPRSCSFGTSRSAEKVIGTIGKEFGRNCTLCPDRIVDLFILQTRLDVTRKHEITVLQGFQEAGVLSNHSCQSYALLVSQFDLMANAGRLPRLFGEMLEGRGQEILSKGSQSRWDL